MRSRPPPLPPRPELLRRPTGPFGWLDAELLHDGRLRELGPGAIAVITLLALAADRHGASFFSRDRMAGALGMTRHEIDEALTRLVDADLIAHRPWRPGAADGVWQLLPVPRRAANSRPPTTGIVTAADILRSLGLGPTAD